LRHTPGHVIDVVPTILEAVGGKPFETVAGQAVPPAPGKSLMPVFLKDGARLHDSLWWLHEDNRAFRVADWKIVAAGTDRPWELYDLSSDRAESKNLARGMPDKVKELASQWERKTEEFRVLAAEN
ncbi:MAG: atsA 10, partial [Planctomycetaceae bacterium]|nr:atsA 10 [Planctomycetaceae bacterium]